MQFLPEKIQHTLWWITRMRLSAVYFITENWSNLFNNGVLYWTIDFKCIFGTFSEHYSQLFYKLFIGATESGRSMRGCKFGNILPGNVLKCHRREIHVFWKQNTKSFEFYSLEPCLYTSVTDIAETNKTLCQKGHNRSDSCITVKLSRRMQNLRFT